MEDAARRQPITGLPGRTREASASPVPVPARGWQTAPAPARGRETVPAPARPGTAPRVPLADRPGARSDPRTSRIARRSDRRTGRKGHSAIRAAVGRSVMPAIVVPRAAVSSRGRGRGTSAGVAAVEGATPVRQEGAMPVRQEGVRAGSAVSRTAADAVVGSAAGAAAGAAAATGAAAGADVEEEEEGTVRALVTSSISRSISILAAATLVLLGAVAASAEEPSGQTRFKSPEAAWQALVTAARAGDRAKLVAILGPEAEAIVNSGDEVQ